MMLKKALLALMLFVAVGVGVLATPDTAEAQRWRRWGGGWYAGYYGPRVGVYVGRYAPFYGYGYYRPYYRGYYAPYYGYYAPPPVVTYYGPTYYGW